MVFVSSEVPFPATSDRRSRVAGNGTEWEVKTIELSSSTSWGEQWAFLHFFILTAIKKTVRKWRNSIFPWKNKKGTSWHEREKCTALCAMSFDGFSALFALFTWKVEQFTVKMDHFLAEQWLFCFSNQTTFWVFWWTKNEVWVNQKTQKVVW